MKLDISKSFDSVTWPYLLNVMCYLGFGQRWLNWISNLWCILLLLFAQWRKRVLHCRGMRQGDPLSLMLFLLTMERLHRLFQKAQQQGILQRLSNGCDTFRVSLYANDAAVFINPSSHDLHVTTAIRSLFVDASGLKTNLPKTQVYPIRCEHLSLTFLNQTNLDVLSAFAPLKPLIIC
jgi:hypothetical protein